MRSSHYAGTVLFTISMSFTAGCLTSAQPGASPPPSDNAPASTAGELRAATREPTSLPINIAGPFRGFDAALALFDESADRQFVSDATRCGERLAPCSTFKIPHTLIALATGAVRGADEVIPWDGVRRERRELNRDHDLRSAVRDSVLWYYQVVAERVGLAQERAWLQKLDYGNAATAENLTTFWIDGTLRISALEQLEFVRRLASESLPVDRRVQQVVKELLVVDRGDNWTLFGKTGTGATRGNPERATLGWFVGWLRLEHRNYYFAANIQADTGATGPHCRKLVRALLAERYTPEIAEDSANR